MSAKDITDKSKSDIHHRVTKLKSEFVLLDYKPRLAVEYLPKTLKDELTLAIEGDKRHRDSRELEGDQEGPSKKKIKLKGRNKKCPRPPKIHYRNKLCPSVISDQNCRYGPNCRFNHDLPTFLSSKPADISTVCHNFQTFGKCSYGVACRFAAKHISEDFKNIVNESVFKETNSKVTVRNTAPKDVIGKLWKKAYNFDKANLALKKILNLSQNLPTESTDGNFNLSGNRDSSKCQSSPQASNNDRSTSDAISSEHESSSLSTKTVSRQESNDLALDPHKLTFLDSTNPFVSTSGDLVENSSITTSGDKVENSSISASGDKVENSSITTSGDKVETTTVCQQKFCRSSGCLTDEDVIMLRPQEKKLIDFSNKLYLAPLTTVGNLPFRRICKQFGADITCGEMAVSTNILQGHMSEWALLKRHVTEDIFGVQLCGSFPDSMTRCAQLINETLDVDFVDINCGCPIDLVYNRGEGCALMGKKKRFEQIIKGMVTLLDVPISVKIRTGIYSGKPIAHSLLPKLRDWGVSYATVHGRSREQRYTKCADWDYISTCVKAGAPLPIVGNGDIMSYEDAILHQKNSGVSGLMIARGALIKPWIFTEIKEQRHWDISANERLDILRNYVNNGLEHWGSDQQGVDTTRRFLLEWLSFLHRYIPVGILESAPQKIHERPPHYRGRCDLETLMASANCADWIKISEMLLGPVPPDFAFLPKHKANAYQ